LKEASTISPSVSTTLGITRTLGARFVPDSIEELERTWKTRQLDADNISVVSRGNNWGYGCHAPSLDGDLVIDLRNCNRIVEFDPYHGVVTLQPGVSYGQLATFLKEHGDQWIAPVHGGGPDGSVMGNALERGYGLTPHSDHFGAVMSLRAILPNGDIYQSPFKALGLDRLAKLFRYGVGPYCDGLFTQSGLGIVTEVTIRLARKPSFAELFYFTIKTDADLALVVEAIKKSKLELGSTLGSMNLINRERCLSMLVEYPPEKVKAGLPLTEEELSSFAKQFQVQPWMVSSKPPRRTSGGTLVHFAVEAYSTATTTAGSLVGWVASWRDWEVTRCPAHCER
jgi:4-cresol dehydrogenase (hydroxylating) flavoprotein subunit